MPHSFKDYKEMTTRFDQALQSHVKGRVLKSAGRARVQKAIEALQKAGFEEYEPLTIDLPTVRNEERTITLALVPALNSSGAHVVDDVELEIQDNGIAVSSNHVAYYELLATIFEEI